MLPLLSAVILVRKSNVSLELTVAVIWVAACHLQFFQELLLAVKMVGCAWVP